MKNLFLVPCLIVSLVPGLLSCSRSEPASSFESAREPLNVLFIAIDDLNDWAQPFAGHPDARTPHMDRLARGGAVVFQRAHCPGPVCGPSRSALLSGFMPHRTGAYGNAHQMLYSDLVQERATLPEYFAQHGYHTLSRGKIFHAHGTENGLDRGQWAFEEWVERDGRNRPDPARVYSRNRELVNGTKSPTPYNRPGGTEFAWGPTLEAKEDTSDYRTALWAAARLREGFDKPFFLAVGLSKPHLPWYVPREYFERYDVDSLTAPDFLLEDYDDILTPEGNKKFEPTQDFLWTTSKGLVKEAARAYLAASSYADDCMGVILDALEQSPYADNTAVVLWGDHGWHLGEKLRYRKAALWIESTRMPLLIRLPGMKQREDCMRVVNLIDLYPTLIDLCGLPAKPDLDGRSLAPLLRNPEMPWPYPVVTVRGEETASVRDEHWSYIRYQDGTEELYSLDDDPMEWHNLIQAMTPAAHAAKTRLAAHFPLSFARPLPTYPNQWKKGARGFDWSLKETRDIRRLQ